MFKSFPACQKQQQEIAERGNMKAIIAIVIIILVAIIAVQFYEICDLCEKHDKYIKAEARQKAEKKKADVLALQEREKVRRSKILDLRHKVEEMKCISDTERIQICEQAIELNDVSALQELYSKFGWMYFGYEDQILTEEQQCLILRAARKANPEIFRFLLERFVNVGWRG
jgi:endonuclease/exonuclease/phosphatase family metal-dependent hydrolase